MDGEEPRLVVNRAGIVQLTDKALQCTKYYPALWSTDSDPCSAPLCRVNAKSRRKLHCWRGAASYTYVRGHYLRHHRSPWQGRGQLASASRGRKVGWLSCRIQGRRASVPAWVL